MADGSRFERGLRVALVSSCARQTPPTVPGGIELFVSELARELRNLGHEPTVFATGDSTCAGAQRCFFDTPVRAPDELAHLRHAAAAWKLIARGDFDVVHVNEGSAIPFSRFVPVPSVATIHHDRVDAVAHHYASFPDVTYVAVSQRQADLLPDLPLRVVHHGLDVDRYPAGDGGGAVTFLGRCSSNKGTHLAIEAAKRAGVGITIAGHVDEADRAYVEEMVSPWIGEDVRWIGEQGHYRRVELLRHSRALLFPIQWEEPFGFEMIEAMLVGTPVVALARGAAPEIVDEGKTGYLVDNVHEMALRIRDAAKLPRARCREIARERWSSDRMARAYVGVYRRAIASYQARGGPSSRRPFEGAQLEPLRAR